MGEDLKVMVESGQNVRIAVNPEITPSQLYSFYERNDVCEKGFGIEVASRVLDRSSLIVGAFCGDELIGIARAMFDGNSANIMEFSLDLRYQGDDLKHKNGSVIEKDAYGIGKKIGLTLIKELMNMGATFFSCDILEDCEEEFYRSLGFKRNKGLLPYFIDVRPYSRGLVKDWGWEAGNTNAY